MQQIYFQNFTCIRHIYVLMKSRKCVSDHRMLYRENDQSLSILIFWLFKTVAMFFPVFICNMCIG